MFRSTRTTARVRTTTLAVGIVTAALGLTACSTSSAGSDAAFNDQDVTFAQSMIPHHEQAVEMSEIILDADGIDPRVTELAEQFTAEQEPEITEMEAWLDDWDAPDTMSGMDHSDGGMSGMMSDDEVDALDDAEGAEASREYLELMTAHHEGAIEMAETEVDSGRFPDAKALATRIIETQTAELDVIESILTTL